MRKLLKYLALLVALVVAAGLVALLVFPGRVVRHALVTGGPLLLKTDISVETVRVMLRAGTLTIDGLTIGSPEGFRADSMFKLERIHVDLDPRSLLSDTIRVREILIDRPEITYEMGLRGSNIGALLKTLESEQEQQPDEAPGKRVVIDLVRVANARVRVSATITGGTGAVLPLPTVELRDLGKEDEDADGVTILEGYGLTETSAATTVNRPTALKIGTVGQPFPGASVKVAADGELLLSGAQIFDGYWKNPTATAEAIEPDGWFHSGDIGEIDDEGFVKITGRKKELLVTAGGKNVAPAVLEDRLRANYLVSQCMVVGDGQPFIAALVTIDPESFPAWLKTAGKPESMTIAEAVKDPDLIATIQGAVDEANKAVSKAESIRKFAILDVDWTEEGGQLTPSMKLKRNVVMKEFAADVDALYA